MVKAFELAIAKAADLSEVAQEHLALDLLERIDALSSLRAEILLGLDELDARKGEPLDIEGLIRQVRGAVP